MILLFEGKIRRRMSSVMGDRYVKTDENKKILFVDANSSYGHSMSQSIPYDDFKFDKKLKLEDILMIQLLVFLLKLI